LAAGGERLRDGEDDEKEREREPDETEPEEMEREEEPEERETERPRRGFAIVPGGGGCDRARV
jgi:hypothetical protein